MPTTTAGPTARREDAPEVTTPAALRDDLMAASFTVADLQQLWGEVAGGALARGHRLPARRALVGRRDPLSVLARLFVLGDAVTAADLETALPRTTVEGARALGLVEIEGETVQPLLDLRPYSMVDGGGGADWWILSDLGEQSVRGPLREDHVLGVGGASLTLARLQLPDPVGSVLDLGTGSGIQALHASRYADHVVATDISARALELASVTAEINGVSIETRLGSLFEPVRPGERFDRVISNPPFVVTPRVEGVPAYEYRDAGLVGDALVQAVVAGLPDVLAPNGIAQLLGNWEYRDGDDGLDRVRSWVDGAGLDAWVIERERLDPSAYAETWIRDGGTRPGTEQFEHLHTAWLDDFEARGVTAIGFGYLLLRAPAARPTLARYEVVTTSAADDSGALGAHLAACLAIHDWQETLDDEELTAAHLVVAPDVTEQRHLWPGDEHPAAIDLRQGAGFGRSVPLDTALAGFVGACDGELPVGRIISALASLLDVSEHALRADLLPAVRRLLDDAMLLPAA